MEMQKHGSVLTGKGGEMGLSNIENKTNKIYVLSKGEYSDRHVIGATTDKALAERMREMYSTDYDYATIDEFEDGVMEDWYTPHQYWRVGIGADGEIAVISRHWSVDDFARPLVDRWSDYTFIFPGMDIKYIVDGITADDEDHAKKIAFDTIARYKAMENIM